MLDIDEVVYKYTEGEFQKSNYNNDDEYGWTLINSFSYNFWVHKNWSECQYRVFQSCDFLEDTDSEESKKFHYFKVTESVSEFRRFDSRCRKDKNFVYIAQSATGAKHIVQKRMLFMLADLELDSEESRMFHVEHLHDA